MGLSSLKARIEAANGPHAWRLPGFAKPIVIEADTLQALVDELEKLRAQVDELLAKLNPTTLDVEEFYP